MNIEWGTVTVAGLGYFLFGTATLLYVRLIFSGGLVTAREANMYREINKQQADTIKDLTEQNNLLLRGSTKATLDVMTSLHGVVEGAN